MAFSTRRVLRLLRHSKFFLGLGLLVAWGAFYQVLRAGDQSRGLSALSGQRGDDKTESAAPPGASEDTQDILEREIPTFNVSELPLSALAKILEQSGLQLAYDDAQSDLKLDGRDHGGKRLAEILIDLLRPHGLGFYRQGDTIHIVQMTLKREQKRRDDQKGEAYQSRLLRATIKAKVGEPIDLWIDSNPLLRLRVIAQPLYGEESAPEGVGAIVEGRRDQQPWFHHDLEARFGQPSQIQVQGNELMWCKLKPVELRESEITLEMEFYYETSLPVS